MTTLQLPNRVSPGLSHPSLAARKNLCENCAVPDGTLTYFSPNPALRLWLRAGLNSATPAALDSDDADDIGKCQTRFSRRLSRAIANYAAPISAPLRAVAARTGDPGCRARFLRSSFHRANPKRVSKPRKSLRLNILPVNPMNAIFCEDFIAAALCFQYFAEKRGRGVPQGIGVSD